MATLALLRKVACWRRLRDTASAMGSGLALGRGGNQYRWTMFSIGWSRLGRQADLLNMADMGLSATQRGPWCIGQDGAGGLADGSRWGRIGQVSSR